jgi:hypothetical protein
VSRSGEAEASAAQQAAQPQDHLSHTFNYTPEKELAANLHGLSQTK